MSFAAEWRFRAKIVTCNRRGVRSSNESVSRAVVQRTRERTAAAAGAVRHATLDLGAWQHTCTFVHMEGRKKGVPGFYLYEECSNSTFYSQFNCDHTGSSSFFSGVHARVHAELTTFTHLHWSIVRQTHVVRAIVFDSPRRLAAVCLKQRRGRNCAQFCASLAPGRNPGIQHDGAIANGWDLFFPPMTFCH